ncbi:MAG TPA: biotin/lipoyl-containing protein, partial [Nevskiaceae bacterium]
MTDAVRDIRMPKLGESIAEGTIAEWMKKVGDRVEFDEPLFLVETDKIATEFPSPEEGVLLEILAPTGATVPVGALLARIGAATEAAARTTAPAAPPPTGAPLAQAAASGPSARAARHGRLLSPVVRRLASAHGIDLERLTGSGAGGRITREDVRAEIARRRASTVTATTPAAATSVAKAASTPAAEGLVPPAPAAAAGPVAGGREQVVSLSRIRLVTAARMVESRRISPHVWTSVEVDLENVAKLRARHKERFHAETGASLSYLPFIMRAVCDALHAYPAVNA